MKGANTTNAIKIENTEEHTNCITFDYLNRLEGGILQVIHTGKINSITVSPKLIDGKIVEEFINNQAIKKSVKNIKE